VTSGYNAALAEQKTGIRWIDYVWIPYGIDFIHANYFCITSKQNLLSTANNIHMSNPYMITDYDLFYAEHKVEMADRSIITYLTFTGIDNAQSDSNSLTNFVAEENPITRSFYEARQQCYEPEHGQPEFAGAIHLIG